MKKPTLLLAAAAAALLGLLHQALAVIHRDDAPETHGEEATDATREVSPKYARGGRAHVMLAGNVRYAHAVGSAGLSEARGL
jgi:hypothetical protein